MDNSKENYGRLGLMGLQHLFAMFGATILVPLLTGLNVSVTLISVGIGTLIFHFLTKGRIPAFLGSSFAFLVGIQLITDPVTGLYADTLLTHQEKLAYATGAIFVSGSVYLLFALIIKLVGIKNFLKVVPPVVTSPTVILIGIILAPVAVSQSLTNPLLAVLTLLIIVITSTFGKGIFKIIPILLGIVAAYLIAIVLHQLGFTNLDGSAILDFASTSGVGFVGLPEFMFPKFDLVAIIVMLPFAFATVAEHIGDMTAISSVTGQNFLETPGLSRTLLGDGIASMFSALFGGPANTTYGENVGVLALTKVFDPRVIQLAAIYAILLGFSPFVAAIIHTIPVAIIGGASFMLYGMIAAVGIRNLVDNQVDISHTKNLIIIALMLVTGLGLNFGPSITFTVGTANIPIDSMGIGLSVLVGIVLNLVLPEEMDLAK